jgi:NAD(P)-dependent dehydrogenase (short-subunit alcohol dehydrogenase family)
MKHVVITGVSRGLGRAAALRFAADGWIVSGCGTNAAALKSLAQELGPAHLAQVCDVTDADAVAAFATSAYQHSGAPDLLLNNAATINPNKPLWEVTAEEFARVIDVNLKGVHLILRDFLPAMIQRGTGVVVNFSSGWGRSTAPEVAPYCATKWGIEGLTAALAQELTDEQIAIAIRDALTATQTTRSGTVEPDHKTRLQAATLALAYKHGRPVERQEIITANLSENDDAILERVKNSAAARAALRRVLDSAEEGQN